MDSIFGTNDYIEYQPGKLNVIISIPHGGSLKPSSIPNRDAGVMRDGHCVYSHCIGKKDVIHCAVAYKRDDYTKELGILIADQLQLLTTKRPHVIINHLYRGKMDANCDLEKATFHIPDAVEAWLKFHNFIEQAKFAINGPGLLLDIHGQIHPENWIELGYTISAEKLNNKSYTYDESSIRSLAERHNFTESASFQSILYGTESLGSLLEQKGYRVVPCCSQPAPFNKHFYSGGYNTLRHGSRNGGLIDAVQLESPHSLRTSSTAPNYAADLALVISQYLHMYYKN